MLFFIYLEIDYIICLSFYLYFCGWLLYYGNIPNKKIFSQCQGY